MANEPQTEEQQPAIQSTMSAAPKQLTSADILGKMEAGQPLYQGETLPDVPKGVSAKGFYGQFPGGASVYSQAPFAQATYGTYLPASTTPTSTTPASPTTTPTTTPTPAQDTTEEYTGLDYQYGLDTQMSNLTTGDAFDFEWDHNDISGSLSKNFAEWNAELRLNTGIDLTSVEGTLNGVGNKLATGLQGTYDEAITALTEVKEDIEQAFEGNPLENAFNYITEEINEALKAISSLANPDTYKEGLTYFGEQFAKTMLSQIISGAAKAMGLGIAAGPIGILGTMLLSKVDLSATQIGMPGQVETLTPRAWGKDGKATEWDLSYTNTTIAYFDRDGIARDKNHNQVLTPGDPAEVPGAGLGIFGSPTYVSDEWGDVEGMMGDPYGQIDYGEGLAGEYERPEAGGEAAQPSHITSSAIHDERADFQPIGTRSGTTDGGTTPSTPSATKHLGTTFEYPTDRPNFSTHPAVIAFQKERPNFLLTEWEKDKLAHGYPPKLAVPSAFGIKPDSNWFDPKKVISGEKGGGLGGGGAGEDDLTTHTPPSDIDVTQAQVAVTPSDVHVYGDPDMGEDSDDQSGGEAGDDSGKIICTMMNRMYGLGEYRIKQWLLYSDRYLTSEHQLGYHKLYCNLVAKMPTNRTLAKILSHLADKRTDDIVAEMKGTKRSWLGRFYRTTLIDGPSYLIGSMIKNNWLKPADISVLQKT